MAFSGSIQNKRPGAGVYPGAGVAKGGQQGRNRLVANGAAAVKSGGYTPRATGALAGWMHPASVRHARPIANSHGALRPGQPKYVTSPVGGAAVKPAPGVVAHPEYVPQFSLHDSDYFTQLADATHGYESQVGGINSDLARLQNRVGGKSLYDTMFERAQNDYLHQMHGARDDMNKRGLRFSGAMDRGAGDLASGYADNQRGLDEQYGATAINSLNTQLAQQRAAFSQQQQLLEMAAASRAQDRLAAANAAAYGSTIMPQEG